MQTPDDYAELYTRAERVRFVGIGLAVHAVLFVLWTSWGLPWWEAFAERAPCVEFAGIDGVTLLFHALFVGLPLLMTLAFMLLISRRGLRILRDQQVPYRGEKVFRPTRIRRGRIARLIGWAHVLSPLPFVIFTAWGASQAATLSTGFVDDAQRQALCNEEDVR